MIPRIFLGLSAQARLGGVARLARLARSTTISQPATLTHTRTYAQPPNTNAVESMSTHTFHQLSDKVFDSLVETLEAEIEGGGFDVAQSSEVELNSGVLTLSLDKYGTYVINKQPPTRQIWVSSPFSGPRRYEFDSNQRTWLDVRDGSSLNSMLDDELTPILNTQLNLGEGWIDS
ncbi:hypothetical protein E3P84_02053 [Wallemia ichthyophaga]|nr:hypothetical protein E3P84_02053 [Wallemia ichthyophaga]TIB41307.1 hypothetical protein E3P83_02078 [Wallemia ichthyophaga]